MNQQRSPWRRWRFGIAATTGLVAYALGATLMAQSAPAPPPQPDLGQITLIYTHKNGRLPISEHEKLDDLAEKMKDNRDVSAQIIGYAAPDEFFPGHTPQHLAEYRAERAREYLINHHGIDPARIPATGEECSPENDEVYKCHKVVITLRQE
jgi:hypothetical protein